MSLPILTEANFRKALKKTPHGGYLFFGEEDYTKSSCLTRTRETVTAEAPSLSAFNDIRLCGPEFTPADLLQAMAVPPIGAESKVITVTGLPFKNLRASVLNELEEALSAIGNYPYNLVILSASSDMLDEGFLPNRPSELLTRLSEHLTLVRFERNSPEKLRVWAGKHYLFNGVEADPALCRFTIDYCGTDMYTLSREIDKISCFVRASGRTALTEADIREVSVPTMEYSAFAFANAITERRAEEALSLLNDFRFRRMEPLLILSDVSRIICDMASVRAMADGGQTVQEISAALSMHPYRTDMYFRQVRQLHPERLNHALSLCRETDRKLKTSASDGYGLLAQLICSL